MGRQGVTFDPAVSAILNGGQQRQQERTLTRAQRKERARQAARVRVTLDVPEWLRARLMEGAERREVSVSTFGAYLLMEALRQWESGALEVKRVPSGSPRFPWLADVPDDDPGW